MHDAMADDPQLADHLTQNHRTLHRVAQDLRSVDRAP
jgi:hypothetical protein